MSSLRRSRTRRGRKRQTTTRSGYVLVWFALGLSILLGMCGLVIDSGLLMASHRQIQNMADTAALAAAMHMLKGQSFAAAKTEAANFVNNHNGLTDATVVVNSPPQQGPYATGGSGTYVEAIVTDTVTTFFAHFLPGVGRQHPVQARAVAGYEAVTAREGVIVLDPTSFPGLDISGGGVMRVRGSVVVNSEGGGVDENGDPVNNGNSQWAAKAGQPNSGAGIYANHVHVVGGVDYPALFKPYNLGDPPPLDANQTPEPDPLINLPTPMISSGVDPTPRGEVKVTQNNVQGMETNDPATGMAKGENFEAAGGEVIAGGMHVATAGEAILHPGIYHKIEITGGAAYFIPGIYVLAAQKENQNVLSLTGGNVTFNNSMFYITGDNYDPNSGWPDIDDGEQPPPLADGAKLGRVSINAEMHFTAIDADIVPSVYGRYAFAPAILPSEAFNGTLFYQRRGNNQTIKITGNSAGGQLQGTMYAKWGHVQITGQGTYDAQFVIGTLAVTGNGDVQILHSGSPRARGNHVFLVE